MAHPQGTQRRIPFNPGNCGGNLIRDLLLFFRSTRVADPMSGSGTCRDVCDELAIPCVSFDIHQGYDACDVSGFPTAERYDFIWAHPPYFRQKLYATDPRDLSRAKSFDDFLARYSQFLRNCAKALSPNGKLAILMGFCDILGYVMLFSDGTHLVCGMVS